MIKRKNRYQFPLFQVGCIAGVMLALCCFLLLPPAVAQGNQKSSIAPVILDGRQIFQVSSSGQFTAKERAELVNSQLRDAVLSSVPVKVKVEKRNQLPTILLVSIPNRDLEKGDSSNSDLSDSNNNPLEEEPNKRYLLTVTELDTPAGSTPDEQAQVWTTQIQQAMNKAQQERSGKYIREALIEAGAIALAAFTLHLGLGFFWRYTIRRGLLLLLPVADSSNPNPPPSFDLFLYLTLLSARGGLWLAAVLYITNLFPLTRRWSYQITGSLITTFTAPIITLSNKPYSVMGLLILICLWWGLIMLAGSATNILRSRVLQVAGINRGAQELIAVLTKYCLITFGTVILLQIWGLDLSSLTILASALGVGIGFGLQDIAKNFGSGLVLILERPIQIGDFIEVGEYKGIVERIGSRSTVIRTIDQVSIIVPNSRFLEKELINWNHHNSISGVRLQVGVSYNANIDEVREALLESVSSHPDVLSVPEPQVLLQGFGDYVLKFELCVWTAKPSQQFSLKSDLYYQIEANLRQKKIEIPFPQRDLHLRTGNLPLELSPQLEAWLLQLLQKQKNGFRESDTSENGSADRSISRDHEGYK